LQEGHEDLKRFEKGGQCYVFKEMKMKKREEERIFRF
jgi:hypothetical protein